MKVLKVIEVLGNSNESWEGAANNVVSYSAKTLNNIRSIYVKEMEARVENNKIVEYRINAKVTFELEE